MTYVTPHIEIKAFGLEANKIKWTVFNFTRWIWSIRRTGGNELVIAIWTAAKAILLIIAIVIDIPLSLIEWIFKGVYFLIYGTGLLFWKLLNLKPIMRFLTLLATFFAGMFIYMLFETGYWRLIKAYAKILFETIFL